MKSNVVPMLLRQAAEWHANAADAPKTAAQRLREFRKRYRADEAFRQDIDAGARMAREMTNRRRAVEAWLRQEAETRAPFPEMADELYERLYVKYLTDSHYRSAVDAHADYLLYKALSDRAATHLAAHGRAARC
jgi:hypothetical protein